MIDWLRLIPELNGERLMFTPLEADALMVAIENYIRKAGKDLAENHPMPKTIIYNLQHIQSAKEKLEASDSFKTSQRILGEMLNITPIA